MNFLTQYQNKIVKYDLINTFNYKLLPKLPEIEHITLSLKVKKPNIKFLSSAMIALTLLTSQKGSLTKSKISNISLKIRKGHPIGCKITLRKKNMNMFLFELLNKILATTCIKTIETNNLFSINVRNALIFPDIEKNYQFFKNLPCLDVNIKTTKCTLNEFKYLINSYKLVI